MAADEIPTVRLTRRKKAGWAFLKTAFPLRKWRFSLKSSDLIQENIANPVYRFTFALLILNREYGKS
jgi:hypothetical protein